MSEKVLSTRDGAVLTITLNRPDKKNALDGAMYTEMREAFDAAGNDTEVRVVCLTGAGDAFTAGNDLRDFASWDSYESTQQVPVVRLIRRLIDFDKPIVAAVRGAAVGFGTTVLLHCDVVVASLTAKFSLPFVRLGLVPEFASSYLLPAVAGRARASKALLLGEPFSVDEADRMGLISEICEDAELDERASRTCAKLASLAPNALRTVRTLLNPADDRASLHAVTEQEFELFVAGLKSAEHKEAIRAFYEKRTPNFSSGG